MMEQVGKMLRHYMPRLTVTMDREEARMRVEAMEMRIDGYLIRAERLDKSEPGEPGVVE